MKVRVRPKCPMVYLFEYAMKLKLFGIAHHWSTDRKNKACKMVFDHIFQKKWYIFVWFYFMHFLLLIPQIWLFLRTGIIVRWEYCYWNMFNLLLVVDVFANPLQCNTIWFWFDLISNIFCHGMKYICKNLTGGSYPKTFVRRSYQRDRRGLFDVRMLLGPNSWWTGGNRTLLPQIRLAEKLSIAFSYAWLVLLEFI